MSPTESEARPPAPPGPTAAVPGRVNRALLAHIRHELRTPLNAIIGYSEMLIEEIRGQPLEKLTADLQKTREAGNRLLQLVNDLLDQTKIDAGTLGSDLESIGARIRYELRTPINAVVGYSEMLLEDVAEFGRTDVAEDIQKIHQAALRFFAFLDDIVKFSTAEAGQVDLDLKTSAASSLAQDAVAAIRPLDPDDGDAPGAKSGCVLVVEDEPVNRDLLSRRLAQQGYTVVTAENGRQALETLGAQSFDLVLLDIMMPEMNGYQVLWRMKSDPARRDIPVIMISALDDIDSVVRCVEIGADDYLAKPFNPVLLKARVGACLEKKRLRDQQVSYLRQLVGRLARTGPIIANSAAMRQAQKRMGELAGQMAPVLVTGEIGSGKLFVARKIHESAGRNEAAFIVVDCRRFGPGEATQTIFGSAGGADFTNWTDRSDGRQVPGTLHLADRGTLVLQRIENLEPAAQVALDAYLRAQAQGAEVFPAAHVIATTREDLSALARAGTFSASLAERLLSGRLPMPALRERNRDILPLAHLFLAEIGRHGQGPALKLTASAERALLSAPYRHHNVLELREAVEFAAVLAEEGEIRGEHVFTGPKGQVSSLELDVSDLPPVARLVRGNWLQAIRWTMLAVFLSIAIVCLTAGGTFAGRLANHATWALWWPGLMLLFLFVGRVWCGICPVSAGGRAARLLGSMNRPPPTLWLRKHAHWIMALLFALIIWSEYVFDMSRQPLGTGVLLLTLMAAAVVFGLIYQREMWCRYLCPLGSLGASYSVAAPIQVRANASICAARCTTHECVKGTGDQSGCPVFHHPLYTRDGHFCKLCLECVRKCPHSSARLYLRPPLWNVWGLSDLGSVPVPLALAAFLLSLLLLATHDSVWPTGWVFFSAALALTCGLVWALHRLLPRMLCRDADPDPGISARVAVALLILSWGPFMAFHLHHIPRLPDLQVHAMAGLGGSGPPGAPGFAFLALIQLAVIGIAAAFAALTLWRIGARFKQQGGRLSAWGWPVLLGGCLVYLAISVGLVLRRGLHL